MNYAKFVEIHNTTAFYLCCVPYRLRRKFKGKNKIKRQYFILEKYSIQMVKSSSIIYISFNKLNYKISYKFHNFFNLQIGYFFTSFLFVENTARRFVNMSVVTQEERKDPYHYLDLFDDITYLINILINIYTHTFKTKEILKFCNGLQVYCDRQRRNKRKVRETTRSKMFFKIIACSITLISLLNYLIFASFQITYSRSLKDLQRVFFFLKLENLENSTSLFQRSLVIAVHGIHKTMYFVRDIHHDLFLLGGILPMWLISMDFSTDVQREVQIRSGTLGDNHLPSQFYLIKSFKKIYRLSRLFNESYGWTLLGYLIVSFLSYSLSFDGIFLTGNRVGLKLYRIETVCLLAMVLGFGAAFSNNVCSNIMYIINWYCKKLS